MSENVSYSICLFFVLLTANASAAPDSTSEASPSADAFQDLKAVVQKSRNSASYRLRVDFDIDVSDREDQINIDSRGIFQSPYYRLLSETPSGMEVKSFGKGKEVLHIHPTTDEVVTSEELGISSVNRTLLDPFEHMSYLLDPTYNEVFVTREETREVDGQSMEVLRVEVGSEPVRDVMNEFRDQLKRPLKAGKTTAVYRILYEPSSQYIRRIHLTADSEFVKQEEEETTEEWQEDLPEPEGNGKPAGGPVQLHVEATFELTGYESVSQMNIPGDVKRLLDERSN